MDRSQLKKRIIYVDTDSDARSMGEGAARHILNSRTANTNESSDGAVENVISNRKISNSLLPSGDNTTIGSYSDRRGNTIIYFVYNSLGNHGIFRYYPDTEKIEKLMISEELGFTLENKITGINLIGELLYWTDGNQRPRKINIVKANNTGKYLCKNVYLNNILLTDSLSGFSVILSDGTDVAIGTILPGAGTGKGGASLESYAKFLSDGINANSNLSALATASSCGTSVKLTPKFKEKELIVQITAIATSSSYLLTDVADNYYPEPIIEDYINRVKDPFACEPQVERKRDASKSINAIEDKIFQFRTQYVYDDFEKSAWGPISVIASDTLNCAQVSADSPYNYIEIDYSSPKTDSVDKLSVIRGVNIAVREGNTGAWQFVDQLTQAEIVQSGFKYNFYNNGNYTALDTAEAAKMFDAVGLKVKSQEIVDDRIFDGGITEGYDGVCIDAALSTSFEPETKINTWNIIGKVFINNFFGSGQYIDYQPIHNRGDQSNPNDIGFGGFSNTSNSNTYISSYGQKLPLGGFVMYLVGTPYYGVSKQVVGNNPDIQSDGFDGGVYNSTTLNNRIKIRDDIKGLRVLSTFSIPNVPPGKYIMRIASHLTTSDDLSDPSLAYQKTSTYTLQVGGVVGSECELEVKSDGSVVINNITYPHGTYIGDSNIADLTYPALIRDSISYGISGYVTDQDIQPTPATAAELLNDTRVELAEVDLSVFGVSYNGIQNTFNLNWANGKTYTDHNGFFFFTTERNLGPNTLELNIKQITSSGEVLGPLRYNIDGASWSGTKISETKTGIFRNTNTLVQKNSRTILSGKVRYNGVGLENVSVICARGRVDETDANGDWNMYVYGSATGLRADNIYYTVKDNCIATFSSNKDYFNIAIGATATPPQTNLTSPYSGTYNEKYGVLLVATSILSISSGSSDSRFKRGGRFYFGIVYYDRANQSTFVNTSDATKINIPHYTTQQGGVPIGGGKPVVSWQIKHLPPAWATHYQWVRSINNNQGNYLQWTVKTVEYVDDNNNAVGSYTAGTKIKISLESILDYYDRDTRSQIVYQYEDGDRLIMLKTPSQNLFPRYYDLKILGADSGASQIIYIPNLVSMGEILPGTFIELYNPKKDVDQQVYYEFGECFEIGESGGKKYHKGLIQDQDPNNPTTVPATGSFRNGDTWVRSRNIPYGTSGQSTLWQIEDQSISDFYPSLSTSIGRVHVENNEIGRIYRPNVIRFSNKYVEGTKINGLSSFEPLNEKVLPHDYGLITKLVRSRDVLLSMHDNSQTVSIYIGKSVLKDLTGQNLVATSESIISETYEYQGGLGIQFPECVQVDEFGNVYGYDSNKGVLWKRSNNGLEPISDINNRTYFRRKSSDIINGFVKSIPGIYDVAHDQYIISFPEIRPSLGLGDIGDIVIGEELDFSALSLAQTQDYKEVNTGMQTFAFNNTIRKWESFYSFVPEYYGNARNNILVSFRKGELYRHEDSETYCNFYGDQYSQQITIVANEAPSVMKRWMSLSLETNKPWSAPKITTPSGQKSSLIESDFEFLENVYRADFLRDENTPNEENPLIFGDDLLGETLDVTISNSHSDYTKIYAVNLYPIISQTSNQ